MRNLCFFITQVCMCTLCQGVTHSETKPSFNVLILKEKDLLRGMHEVDASNMKQTFKTIGDVLHRHVRITCWDSKKISFRKIKKWCSKIHPEDIAVVYYSGEDCKHALYKGEWPLTRIGKREIPLDQLANEVYSKNAKLSLVFADCYNGFHKLQGLVKRPLGRPLEKVKSKKILHRIKKVWTEAKGTLTLCSSKHGAYARGIIEGNLKFGAFSEALLSAINYGTRGERLLHRRALRYPKMIKLSEYPLRISNHMKYHPFFETTIQIPLYTSTIVED